MSKIDLTASVQPRGDIHRHKLRANPTRSLPSFKTWLATTLNAALPQKDLPDYVNQWRRGNQRHLWRGLSRAVPLRVGGIAHAEGSLFLSNILPLAPDSLLKELLEQYAASYQAGDSFPHFLRALGFGVEVRPLGLASLRVVTTAGVNFIVDAFQNSVELEILKYHGIGTGTNAEAAADTALQTELTTQYNPNDTRATGSLTEGASANIYRTVGTNTVDGAVAITEHGIFSQAATGGGTLLDRSVFSADNLSSGDSLQTTYDLTLTAGS